MDVGPPPIAFIRQLERFLLAAWSRRDSPLGPWGPQSFSRVGQRAGIITPAAARGGSAPCRGGNGVRPTREGLVGGAGPWGRRSSRVPAAKRSKTPAPLASVAIKPNAARAGGLSPCRAGLEAGRRPPGSRARHLAPRGTGGACPLDRLQPPLGGTHCYPRGWSPVERVVFRAPASNGGARGALAPSSPPCATRCGVGKGRLEARREGEPPLRANPLVRCAAPPARAWATPRAIARRGTAG